MDTLVFDIETQNFFSDPDVGWNNFGALKISVVGLYSYQKDKYECFEESQMEELAARFAEADRLVGFSMNRYDIPVLNLYFHRFKNVPELDLWKKERIDLLEEIEVSTGDRISLSRLAEANLGTPKERSGAEAIDLYRSGRMEELKSYCLKDVELTKRLFDMYKDKGELIVPEKGSDEPRLIRFRTANGSKPSTLF